MKVCLFGSYKKTTNNIPSGNGGELLKKILENQGVKVIECQEDVNTIASFVKANVKLFFKHRKLDYDVMIIPWRGIFTLPLAKLIHRKPIIYFPAFSIYDTLVNDRQKIKPNSLKAKLVHFIEKLCNKIADRIILESSQEIKYFVKEYNLPQEKFRQLWLSCDESFFPPLPFKEKSENFVVLYFGEFIPLHGVPTIIEAAKILQDHVEISFILCGDGQTKNEIEKMVQNYNLKSIKLLGLVPVKTLLENLKNSDVCLGIFGNSEKSNKVLTNKVYQILASKKPLITMESQTTIEGKLENEKHCMLIPSSNAKSLADAILYLKNIDKKREEIAFAGRRFYEEKFSMKKTGENLLEIIKESL